MGNSSSSMCVNQTQAQGRKDVKELCLWLYSTCRPRTCSRGETAQLEFLRMFQGPSHLVTHCRSGQSACGHIPVYMHHVCVYLVDACLALPVCRINMSFTWMAFDLILIGLHCCLQLSSTGLVMVMVPGSC